MTQLTQRRFMTVVLLAGFWANPSNCFSLRAEVPLLSEEELEQKASHIVEGKIRAIFSSTEKSDNWHSSRSVAEIVVSNVLKGEGIRPGDAVYAHYWQRTWVGEGDQEPGSNGHTAAGEGAYVRAHVQRKNGAFQVLLPNGLVETKQGDATETSEEEDVLAEELAAVQGKWIRSVETERGTFKILKEHAGNKTKLTIYDPKGNAIEEKTSEFRLEIRGDVRVFTFFNNQFTIGPNKGRVVKAPVSYLYRVAGDTFFEMRGMLIGDGSNPSVITWKRFRVDDLPVQAISRID